MEAQIRAERVKIMEEWKGLARTFSLTFLTFSTLRLCRLFKEYPMIQYLSIIFLPAIGPVACSQSAPAEL